MSSDLQVLRTSKDIEVYYQGPPLKEGPKPAVIFFALSGYHSLFTDPFNQIISHLVSQDIRVFSWDLPFHQKQIEPHLAMKKWLIDFATHPQSLTDFIDLSIDTIDFLIEHQWIDQQKIGVAGLSRGAFVATHLAAKDKRLCTLLGFAPLTHPHLAEDDLIILKNISTAHLETLVTQNFSSIKLDMLVTELLHTELRFYIGNNDTRVNTDICYQFTHHLTQTFIKEGVRSPPVELRLFPSIGHRGHGTPFEIFDEGAKWISKKLLQEVSL